jgi:DNA-binding transcriptional LysR family regulator
MDDYPENYLTARDLKLIDLLYTTHSVTQAAELLGQTQPTVSSWLKRIRKLVKDPLFVRTSEGMSPTPRADFVVEKARDILESMRLISGESPVFDPATASRVFRMCIPDAAQNTLLPAMLRHIRRGAPHVQIEGLPVDKQTAHLLESGEADLAFGGFVPGMEAGIYQQTLFDQDFVCLVSRDHPRIAGELTLADFEREAHVAVGYGSASAVIESELKRQGVKRRVMVTLQGVLGVARIIETTDMITTLPGQIGATIAEGGAVNLFPCPFFMPKIVVKQYWHTRFHLDPGNQWLRSICATQARAGLHLTPYVRCCAST